MDSAAFEKGADSATKTLNRFGKDMQRLSAKMTGIGAALSVGLTAPLAAVGVQMTKMAIDAEEMRSAFNVSFGAMAKDVEAWAVKTGDAMGRSTEEMMQGTLVMHGLFKAGGPATEQTKELAKQFAVLAQDLSSFHNVSPTAALDALKSGLSGEAEPLRRFNVYLTENAVRLQAVKMGLGKMKGELSETAKIQARAALIMAGTTEAQGDVARTADSAANQIRRAKAEWQELAVTIGSKIIPLLTPVVKGIGDILQGFSKLNPTVQTSILFLGALAVGIGPVLIGIGSLIGAIGTITAALGAASVAGAGFTATMAAFLGVAGIVVVTVAALTAGVGLLVYAHSDAALKASANKTAHEKLDPILNVVRESMEKAAAANGELRKSHLEAADAAFIRGEAELEAARKTLAAAKANLAAARQNDANAGLNFATGNPLPGYNTAIGEMLTNRAQAELDAIMARLEKAGLGSTRHHKGYGTTFHVIKPSDAFKEAEAITAVGNSVGDTGDKTNKAKKDTRDYAEEWDRLRESLMGENQRAFEDRADQIKLMNELMDKGKIGVQQYAEALRLMDDKDFRDRFKAQDVGPSPNLVEGLPTDKVLFQGKLASTEQVAEFQQQVAGAFRNGLQALKYGGTQGLFEWMADSFTNRLLDNLANDLSKIFSQLVSQMSTSTGNDSGWGQMFAAVASWFGGSEGFATGGSFKVGGSGRADSKFVGMRLSPGEMVDIRRPGQANDNSAGGLSVMVSKSPLFEVEVSRVATNVAAPMAAAAYSRAVSDAPRNMQRQARSRLG
jgi:hypothetical protein